MEDSAADNESADAENDDDQVEFHADESTKQRPSITPRWPTRVFAAQCVRRIVAVCISNKQAHFDLALAKEMQLSKGKGRIFQFYHWRIIFQSFSLSFFF